MRATSISTTPLPETEGCDRINRDIRAYLRIRPNRRRPPGAGADLGKEGQHVHSFLNRIFVPVMKGLEGLITMLHFYFYFSFFTLICLGIAGISYRPEMQDTIFKAYAAEFGVVLLEALFILVQRLYARMAAPVEKDKFKKLLPSKYPALRFKLRVMCRIFLQPPLVFFVTLVSDHFRKYWLGHLFAERWGRFVSGGNFMIPFFAMSIQFLHMKVWCAISDSWLSSEQQIDQE